MEIEFYYIKEKGRFDAKIFQDFWIVIGALVLIIGGYLLYFHFSHTDAFYPKTILMELT